MPRPGCGDREGVLTITQVDCTRAHDTETVMVKLDAWPIITWWGIGGSKRDSTRRRVVGITAGPSIHIATPIKATPRGKEVS